MKLSELAKKLCETLEQEGDMDCFTGDMEPLEEVEMVTSEDGKKFFHIGDW